MEDEAEPMREKSARRYDAITLKILWGRAAGRCAVPTCRTELYVGKTDYNPIVGIGEIAHIEASSDRGPRANKRLGLPNRDEYENLILLCSNCHKRLDGQKNTNTVEFIRQLRYNHEAWVRNSLPERGNSTTGWATILLQGAHPFDVEAALSALVPDFPDGDPLIIHSDPGKEAWPSIMARLRASVFGLMHTKDPFDFRLAVFPLAPVTACLALGYYLTSRPRVRLFQYHRDEYTWSWPNESPASKELSVSGYEEGVISDAGDVAICFNLSARILEASILDVKQDFLAQIHVTLPSPNTGWLRHENQLKEVARTARSVFETCLWNYPRSVKWHIFFAGPAPAGVVIGQQINPTMSPPTQLYEFRRGRSPAYLPSILLSDGE